MPSSDFPVTLVAFRCSALITTRFKKCKFRAVAFEDLQRDVLLTQDMPLFARAVQLSTCSSCHETIEDETRVVESRSLLTAESVGLTSL